MPYTPARYHDATAKHVQHASKQGERVTNFGAIVLCGGESRRMGQPKAWLPFGDQCLLQHIVRIVSEACSSVIVVSADGQVLPSLPGIVKIVPDERPNCGPLAGLESGLREVSCDVIFLVSCDLPLITAEFVRDVCQSLIEPFEIAVPLSGGFKHPLAAAYRRRLLPNVTAALNSGERKMMNFLNQHQVNYIDEIDQHCLQNINTPAEYAEVLKQAEYCGLISASRSPTALDS